MKQTQMNMEKKKNENELDKIEDLNTACMCVYAFVRSTIGKAW